MATIIDALLITLGLDPAGVKQGAKDAEEAMNKTADTAEKTQDRIDKAGKRTADEEKKRAEEEKKRQKEKEAANKRLEDGYKKVRDSLMDIAAAMVAAVAGKEFVRYITDTDTATTKLATNVGATTKDVMTLRTAFESIGASGDEATGALQAVNKIVEDLKNTGNSEALYPLQKGKLDIGKFRDAGSQLERLVMLSDALKKLSPEDAQYWAQQAHFSEEAVNLLIDGNKALKERLAEMAELNKMSGQDKRAMLERNDAAARLHATFDSMGRAIVTQLTPILVGLEKALTAVFDYLADKPTLATGAIAGLVSVMGLLMGFRMVTWAQQIGGAFGVLGAAAGNLVGRLALVLAAIAAIYEIWQLGKGLWDWFSASHREGVQLTPEAKARIAAGEGNSVSIGRGSGGGTGQWDSLIQSAASKWGVPAELIRSVMQVESHGNAGATSNRGAMGLMQLLPGTARDRGASNPYDPAQNVDAGTGYLHDLLAKYGGNLQMALAAYNWGPGNLDRQGFANRPFETRNYVDSVIAGMNIPAVGGGGGMNVNVGPVTIHTSASTMEGTGGDLGRGLRGRLALAGQSNSNVN